MDKFKDCEKLFDNIKTRVGILFKKRIKEFVVYYPLIDVAIHTYMKLQTMEVL